MKATYFAIQNPGQNITSVSNIEFNYHMMLQQIENQMASDELQLIHMLGNKIDQAIANHLL